MVHGTRTMGTLAGSLTLLVALASCSADADQESEEGDNESSTTDPHDTDPSTTAPEADASQRADARPGERTPPGGTDEVPEAELPGVEHEAFSEEGDELGVAGLDPDDAPRDVYAAPAPGGDADVVGELEPTDAVIITGRQRSDVDDPDFGIWTEVELADGYGWVEGGLAYFAGTEDITEDYIGEVPAAPDAQAVVEEVAERYSKPWREDGATPDAGQIAVITTPEDFGEEFYRVDVTGMPDDAGVGARLFVTVEEASDGYELTHLERTQLCQRGVSDDGLCL